MDHFLTFLALMIPFFVVVTPRSTTSATNCSSSPALCPNVPNSPLEVDAYRIKPLPPTVIPGLSRENASGDVLNTTQCYCASPTWQTSHTFGYYYYFTYYNYKHDGIYAFEMTCQSAAYKTVDQHDHSPPDTRIVPYCFRKLHHERYCVSIDDRGEIGNTFCYELDGPHGNDYYTFNHQKRGLPMSVTFQESQNKTLEFCSQKCNALPGGPLDMLNGGAMIAVTNDVKGQGKGSRWNEWSVIRGFGDTDDMCEDCK